MARATSPSPPAGTASPARRRRRRVAWAAAAASAAAPRPTPPRRAGRAYAWRGVRRRRAPLHARPPYRILNERRLGLGESSWSVVASSLYPSERASAALARDVVQPWRGNTTLVRRGTGARAYTLATPLDGNLEIRVRARARTSVTVATRGGRVLRRSATGSVRTTVCGERSLVIRVRPSARASNTLEISRP